MWIKNVTAITMDEKQPVIKDACIIIEGERIKYIGPLSDIPINEKEHPDVLDGRGFIAIPGLINCHTHVGMTLFRGYADDMPLMQWLSEKIWPLEDKLTSDAVYYASLLGILEMIKGGVTVFADMYFFMEETARAVAESGIKAVLARGLQGPDKNSDWRLEENRRLHRQWHGAADGRIRVAVGPHAVYTCTLEYLNEVAELAAELNVSVHMHLSETQQEVQDCLRRYGCSPIKLAYKAGLMHFPMIAAHCVYPVNDDIDLMAEKSVGVVYNPISNMKLGSGFCPINQYMGRGIKIGLGTDSAASNNNLSVFKEMAAAALINKGLMKDPTFMSAESVLRMATVSGASILGFDDTGILKPGAKADIVLVNTKEAHAQPLYSPQSFLVYAAKDTDVDTVIIDGRIVMEHKEAKTIDQERLYHEVGKLVKLGENR